jgi:hypothetical protein
MVAGGALVSGKVEQLRSKCCKHGSTLDVIIAKVHFGALGLPQRGEQREAEESPNRCRFFSLIDRSPPPMGKHLDSGYIRHASQYQYAQPCVLWLWPRGCTVESPRLPFLGNMCLSKNVTYSAQTCVESMACSGDVTGHKVLRGLIIHSQIPSSQEDQVPAFEVPTDYRSSTTTT